MVVTRVVKVDVVGSVQESNTATEWCNRAVRRARTCTITGTGSQYDGRGSAGGTTTLSPVCRVGTS